MTKFYCFFMTLHWFKTYGRLSYIDSIPSPLSSKWIVSVLFIFFPSNPVLQSHLFGNSISNNKPLPIQLNWFTSTCELHLKTKMKTANKCFIFENVNCLSSTNPIRFVHHLSYWWWRILHTERNSFLTQEFHESTTSSESTTLIVPVTQFFVTAVTF